MGLKKDTSFGTKIRWVAAPYSDESPHGAEVVRAGDIGTFLGFDGPGSNEAIGIFPTVGTFVSDAERVEVIE